MAGKARPGHVISMAERHRPAVDVELIRIDAKLVATIDHLHSMGLVQLPQVDIVDRPRVPLQQPRRRGHRADAHLVRLDGGGHESAEDAERLQSLSRGGRIAHDHASGGAVGELARIARADGLPFEDRLDFGKAFRRGIGPPPLALRKRDLVQREALRLLVHHRHLRDDRFRINLGDDAPHLVTERRVRFRQAHDPLLDI
jgi:hypothetical protein